MKQLSFIRIFLLSLFAVVLISSCAHQPAPPSSGVPGFWMGIVHGFFAPLAFIAGLFSDIRIYEFPNTGLWYDFGFMIGIGGFSGGVFGASRRKK